MKYFPDEPASGIWARYAVAALPLVYLAVALLYSAWSAPWGQQVDPESAYAMNGLAWAAGYPMIKNDHPGTTTILLIGLIVKLWTFLAGRSDVVEFGLKNYDAIIYASRAAEALILSGALLASGIIVRNATRSALAALLFQVAPFVHLEAMHFEILLIPESLMVSSAIFGTALVLKAALDETPPSVRLGFAQGLVFALGLSSKYLYAPLAILGVSLLRNRRAFATATLVGVIAFFIFNRVLNPYVFTSGFRWLVNLATHKGVYGEGEAGFIDFNVFWPNMAQIISSGPLLFAVFVTGALAALAQMLTSRRLFDPVSLTLVASFMAFAALLVATSKHFHLHYMVASWVLTGGVLVLTSIEVRRLIPRLSPSVTFGAAALVCVGLIATTLLEVRSRALGWRALNDIGARLSKAVVAAGPSCANVSGMFVRAPENELNHGADMTLATPQMEHRFSEAYLRVFDVPLLDHSYYRHLLLKNLLPYSYARLAAEYPCIVVRTSEKLNAKTSAGLLELKPEHCVVEGIQVYTVGIACAKIKDAMQSR
ncbi:hypothetical protein KMZ68_15075 [Bradyrhizobium sediminis]|uniref:Uncharacterized protein n=1 Tax=Bradyrhizobium sediminis TaxID=2840469 RepID=A0A975RQZ4_9BRAD|nr:hypothetical protein [Bradyrhizobium sediminis]QWG16348.1 hypothetical protein KMZ68_15075 [Bradyrhizobium sediminis]